MRRKIDVYIVDCDYPDHVGDRRLADGVSYHFLNENKVVCSDCWRDQLVVEKLLRMFLVEHEMLVADDLGRAKSY